MRNLERGIALAGNGKWRALGRRIKRAAIEFKRQVRSHLDVAFGVQIAQKWQCQTELAQGVLALAGREPTFAGLRRDAVGEVHRTGVEGDVVQGKAQRFRGGLLGQMLQDVVNVVAPPAQVGNLQGGRIHGDGIKHRCQVQQRLQLGVHINAGNAQLLARAIGRGDGNIGHRQLQRPGLEIDRTNGELAPQRFTALDLDLTFGQGGNDQPGQHPQRKQAAQRPQRAANPGGTIQSH